jgi:hypothetical protein
MAVHRGNRHGRSQHARLAVLEAADDLLVEKGFAQLTVEGIAQRAGVAKQTIYRWWPSKTDILLEAFVTRRGRGTDPPDTGDLTRDLVAHLAAIGRFLTTSDAGWCFGHSPLRGSTTPAWRHGCAKSTSPTSESATGNRWTAPCSGVTYRPKQTSTRWSTGSSDRCTTGHS